MKNQVNDNQTENSQKLLIPLKLSSSYFYSIEPDANFVVTKEMIKVEQMGKWEDCLGRQGNSTLCGLFSGSLVKIEEERDIFTQILRCPIPHFPIPRLLNQLSNDWNELCWSQRQIKAFCNNHGKKILSILNIEESQLPNHLTFLGKHDGKYLIASAYLRTACENEFDYMVYGVENSSMGPYAFWVVPAGCPSAYICEKTVAELVLDNHT